MLSFWKTSGFTVPVTPPAACQTGTKADVLNCHLVKMENWEGGSVDLFFIQDSLDPVLRTSAW